MLANYPKVRLTLYITALILGALGTGLASILPEAVDVISTLQGVLLALIGASGASNLSPAPSTPSGTVDAVVTTGSTEGVPSVALTSSQEEPTPTVTP